MAAASGHTTDQSASAESKSPADTRDWVPETPRRRRTVRFVIERCLGKGGFGVVHKAYDQERKMHVRSRASFVPASRASTPSRRSSASWRILAHPNLVSLYELFADEDSWFIAMELVPAWTSSPMSAEGQRPILIPNRSTSEARFSV